jgi:hypothetical protein
MSFLRALALAGSAASSADCASSVAPLGDVAVGTDAAGADVTPATTCDSPGPANAPCVPPLQCGTGCGAWQCASDVDAGTGRWIQLLCGGPLEPPWING